MKAMCVTGFVPMTQNLQRTPDEFRALGQRLISAIGPSLHVFDRWQINDCWAYQLLRQNPYLKPSCDNPPADRFADPQHMTISNVIMLQKFEWMRLAAQSHPDVEVFAWVDYGIMKQRGVTEDVLRKFVELLHSGPCREVTLPGCWPKMPINDAEVHWRFCGSCWVCPRHLARRTFDAVQTVASLRARLTGKLSWETNTMAYVELLDILPIRWYRADHDASQFLEYRPS
jgi:hypothetical protein